MSWGPGKSKFWTCSTGPKPSQLVPKFIKCALETQNHRIEPNEPIIIFNAASIQHFQLVPNPFNSSKTQSTGPQTLNHTGGQLRHRATANQRIVQPGLVGVMMWRMPMTMMTFVAVLAVIVTSAQVAR